MHKTLEERVQALEDREAIIQLKARYVNYNDGGWKGPAHTNLQAVADMFDEDGVWNSRPSSGYARDRKEIKELFEAEVASYVSGGIAWRTRTNMGALQSRLPHNYT